MANQFTLYLSTDASAPTLSGTAGDMHTVLNACLVTGYGSKVAAGWTRPFTDGLTPVKTACYRAPSGNQLYYRIRDDGGGTGGAKESQLRGFESMVDSTNTNTNGFPTSGQSALTDNSLIIRKSITADATTRPWLVLADARTCYYLVQTGDTANMWLGGMFGEFYALLTGNAYNGMVIGRATENSGVGTNDVLDALAVTLALTFTGHYIARGSNGAVGAVKVNKCADAALQNGNTVCGLGTLAYPNPDDGLVYGSPIRIFDTTTAPATRVIGRMRGLYSLCHAISNFTDGDTPSGGGDLAGKTFRLSKTSGNLGMFAFETSSTLETN
jgi:hypothetical protein